VVLFTELMTFLALFTLTRLDGIPRSVPLTHGLLLAGGLVAARVVVRIVFSDDEASPTHHLRGERIIIIGANRVAAAFIQLIDALSPQQKSVIAVLDEKADLNGKALGGVKVLGAPSELDEIISEFVNHGVCTNRVVVAGESDFLSPPVMQEIERVCKKHQVDLSFLPRMVGLTEPSVRRWRWPPDPKRSSRLCHCRRIFV
jgi:FlaA1/EpsC-like NDP-sugar epimerase